MLAQNGQVYRVRRRAQATATSSGCTNYGGANRLLVSPTGKGYWIATADGSVIAFGDARRLGFPVAIAGQPDRPDAREIARVEARPTRYPKDLGDFANQTRVGSVRSVVNGEQRALGEWVGARYTRAYRTAVLICGNPADAEEAVQDAFLPRLAVPRRAAHRRPPGRVAVPRAGERLLLEAAQGGAEARPGA